MFFPCSCNHPCHTGLCILFPVGLVSGTANYRPACPNMHAMERRGTGCGRIHTTPGRLNQITLSAHTSICESHTGGTIYLQRVESRFTTLMEKDPTEMRSIQCGHTPEEAGSSLGTGSPAGSGCLPSAPLQQYSILHSSSPAGSQPAPQALPAGQFGVKVT